MNFIRQRFRWECAAASTAMLCGATIQEVIDFCGHDGSDVVLPNLPTPMCHRGFAMEEMVDFALTKGIGLVQVNAFPVVTPDGEHERDLWSEAYCEERMQSYLEYHTGLLIGRVKSPSANWHVIVWDHEKGLFVDPRTGPSEKCPIEIAQFFMKVSDGRNL